MKTIESSLVSHQLRIYTGFALIQYDSKLSKANYSPSSYG